MADTFLVIGTGPTVNIVLGTDQTTNIVLSGAGPVYTAGTGIAISGANVISNTAPDQTVTITDGTGIGVTGTYPNFTITNTSPNVVQTISIAGQDLTLSGGGGTVEIPGGASDALGTGFTSGGGTGSIPGETVATLDVDGQLFFRNQDGNDVAIISATGFRAANGNVNASFLFDNDGMNLTAGGNIFIVSTTGATTYEDGASGLGMQYAAYYPDIETSLQSFTDVQTVNSIKQKLATYTEMGRDAISSPATGYVIFCTDATAMDSSTGVMQVWNGSTWKNAW